VKLNSLTLLYEDVSKSFWTESITKCMLTTINTCSEATQRVMVAKLTRLAHKIAYTTAPSGRAVPFTVLAAGSQSRNFWIHPCTKQFLYKTLSL